MGRSKQIATIINYSCTIIEFVRKNRKLGIIGIAIGIILITSVITLTGSPPAASIIKDLEMKREQKLDIIDRASVYWQQGLIGHEEFIAVIEQSITDTEDMRDDYLSLDVPPRYDVYKSLSIDSLNKQMEAFLKLKEYVEIGDLEQGPAVREEFDRLMLTSFEYRRDALRELKMIDLQNIGSVNALP